tara:strand:+ start:1800 stop:3746 length:1947 start_codon:yes stop_codon:yes gene_type:complete
VGWGASTCVLIAEMHKNRILEGKKILLIDPDDKKENDKTFCFWAKEDEEICQDYSKLISTSWDKIQINNGCPKLIDPLKYFHIKSIDLYDYSREIISKYDFSCIKTLVLSVENQVCLSVKTDQKEYFGHYVFDSRPKKIREPFQKKYSISQSFYGLKIKLKRRSFEDRVYRMMDFRVSQAKATQFVYILPYSKDTALIELTRFGKDILQINEAENILNKFIECNFGEYTVVGKERGIIPMTPVSPRGNTKANVINIGTRGGNVKPSTGYAFKNMYDQSRLICNSVSFKNKSLSKKNRFLFYDQLLLIILTRWPEKGRFIFERLFKTNSPVFVLNFLDEKTKFFGELKMFLKLQIGIFLKSVFFWILWKGKKHIFSGAMILCVFLPSSIQGYSDLSIAPYQILLLALGLIVIGIPHGALDHFTEAIDKGKKITIKFVARYLALMIPIFLIWLWQPSLALIVFLLYSAWHFGQTDAKQWGVESKAIGFIWGAILLSYLFITHLNEFNIILSALKIPPFENFQGIRGLRYLIIVLGFIFPLIFRRFEWFLVVVFLLLSQYTNLIFSFGIYFVLHHSRIGWHHLKRKLQVSHSYMFKKALPFNLGAIALFCFFFVNIESGVKENIAYFFVFLSCVSFPHVLCMNAFYSKQAE